ncbi:MAG TPA: hypothetical protein VF981_06755 [Gemmatimonadaceae bacterium]
MRSLLLAVPFAILACSPAEEAPPADAPATAMAAALTEADVAGTWTGTAMIEGTDSVFSHWTQVCGGGTCRGTSQESPDTVVASYMFDADSSIGMSNPMPDPTMGGTMVVDRWVVRITNGQATGTGMVTLAERPDSVIMRYRLTGTRVP